MSVTPSSAEILRLCPLRLYLGRQGVPASGGGGPFASLGTASHAVLAAAAAGAFAGMDGAPFDAAFEPVWDAAIDREQAAMRHHGEAHFGSLRAWRTYEITRARTRLAAKSIALPNPGETSLLMAGDSDTPERFADFVTRHAAGQRSASTLDCMNEEPVTLGRAEQQRALVLNQLLEGRMTPGAAALLLRLSVRPVQRRTARYRAAGPVSLVHGTRGRTPWQAVAPGVAAQVVALARTTDAGLK